MGLYHLFDLDSGQTGLIIPKGLCGPVPTARAGNLGSKVVLSPLAENYSLFACHMQFICGPRCWKSFNTPCLPYVDFSTTHW